MDATIALPAGWTVAKTLETDENGGQMIHLAATNNEFDEEIDVFIGSLPEDTTAEDQAFSNYAEMVGFDENDPLDSAPIVKFKFNGKNAWGFEAIGQDSEIIALFAQEAKQGILSVVSIRAENDTKVQQMISLVEKGLRIK